MSTAPARPPRRYRITQVLEPPPEWWAGEFAVQQHKIRVRLEPIFLTVDRPLAFAEVFQRLTSFTAREVEHALNNLVKLGLVVAEARTYYSRKV